MTTLASVFQTKLVPQMMIKTDQNKLENFTCFNDAILSISPTCNFLFLQYLFTAKHLIIVIVPQNMYKFFINFVTAVKSFHGPSISKELT